jgi:hypothetical protein
VDTFARWLAERCQTVMIETVLTAKIGAASDVGEGCQVGGLSLDRAKWPVREWFEDGMTLPVANWQKSAASRQRMVSHVG